MKATDIKRGIKQYKDLEEIKNKEEFLHCFVYELAIRDIKELLIKRINEFYLNGSELCLHVDTRENLLNELAKSDEYNSLKIEVAKLENLTGIGKLVVYNILKLEDDLRYYNGLNLVDLYIDYTFFNDDFREKFYSISNTKKEDTLILKKDLYDGIMKSEAYFHSEYIRVKKFYPKMKNENFRDITTHYALRYKRPMFHGTILSNNKKADITINADLPKDLIMNEVEKLVDIIKNDSKNIDSNKDKVLHAYSSLYEKNVNIAYKQKRLLVDHHNPLKTQF
ncbi:hypothetical protein FJR45_00290 [Sulfurimonas sediminis]|uniref:Uncharacterized protein n=1 Tax=Sulfurimonas sediminis TaxID=2590020 RepID=A0A7M1AYF1_9BACT|nr:hypothetical protein [Sulfurimonas sediminis]QOP42474.1 hypothetical protein FJR45_00290 [Sulfurimonas sediminis]